VVVLPFGLLVAIVDFIFGGRGIAKFNFGGRGIAGWDVQCKKIKIITWPLPRLFLLAGHGRGQFWWPQHRWLQ